MGTRLVAGFVVSGVVLVMACSGGGGGGSGPDGTGVGDDGAVADVGAADNGGQDFGGGGGLLPGQVLDAPSGDIYHDPKVATVGAGARAVWLRQSAADGTYQIRYAERTGDSWGAPADVPHPQVQYPSEADVGPCDVPTVTFAATADPMGGVPSLWVARKDAEWTVTEYLKELLIPAGTHASSILPDGTVLAVYDTDSGAGMALVTIAKDESLPTPVKTPECSYDLPYCRHSAAVTVAGDTIYVAYVQSPGIGDVKEELYLVMLKGGESGEPVLVPTTRDVTYAPVLSTNGTAVWLGWGEVDEATMTGIPRDFWVLRVDGAPGTPAKLPKDKDTDGPLTLSPAIPVGSGGEIHTGLVLDAMNLTGSGKPYVLLAFHKKYDGTTWSEVGTVSGGDDTPVMVGKHWQAVDASGKADFVWEDVETASVQSVVRAARF